jgi:malate permease and related proteins
MYANIFTTIAPILICIGAGYIWARLKKPFDIEFVSSLITYIGVPCLVIVSLTSVSLSAETLTQIAGAACLITLTIGVLGAVCLRLTGLDIRVYLPSLMFGNIGNMGLSLCLFAFGEKGLAMGIAYFAALSVLHFTIGISIVQGVSQKQLLRLFTDPIVICIGVAVFLMITGIKLPPYLFNSLKLLGDITIPLMLLTLGVSLSRLAISNLSRSFFFGGLRIGIGFCIGLAVVTLFHLEGNVRGVVLIQSSMPVAVYNYLFALRYNRAPDEVAGIVVFSTLLSFLMLPPLLLFVF